MSVTAFHFWSPTCAPCNAIKPALEDLKEEFSRVVWLSVNTHNDSELLAGRYNVSIVPTIVVEVKNKEGVSVFIEKHSGINIAGYYRIIRNGLRILSQQS
jgi:thiol-disulfide isomerase/thioredoxin